MTFVDMGLYFGGFLSLLGILFSILGVYVHVQRHERQKKHSN